MFTPPRGRGIPPEWEAEQIPKRRVLLRVLRHEAGTLPSARDGPVSIMSALSLMSKPCGDIRMLLGAMRPEDENGRPMLLALASGRADVFRVSVIHGDSIPFSHTERWLHIGACATLSLARGTRECNLLSTIADRLKPQGLGAGSMTENYFSRRP